jgi:hypothetical protein
MRKRVKVKAIMSVPRLTFSDNVMSMAQALPRLGIDLEMVQGVFWGQCLERGMGNAIAQGVDYILVVDYDTLFSLEQVQALIASMEQNAEIDALAPLQVKRDDTNMLLTSYDGQPMAVDQFLSKPFQRVATAHFGLTIIRASKLAQLPHPWFMAIPNKEGLWTEFRTDEDIYFWRNWQQAGRTLYVATNITIGHLQLVATWPTPDMGIVHQLMCDWRMTGKPPHNALGYKETPA